MRKYGRQGGFTIVEIMSVIGVMGVLAVLVIPSIKMNTVRVKVSEAILAFSGCKATISEIYLSGDDSPGGGNWGCEVAANASQYVDNIQTSDEGMITIWLHGFNDPRLDIHKISLTPLDVNGNIMTGGGQIALWRCGSVADATDLSIQYLPASCRG
jgi:type IV pilus assembly protein PilA